MRGNKPCPACGAANGPRSFQCKVCKKPFKIKGVEVTPEQIKEAENRRLGLTPKQAEEVEEVLLNLYDYFKDDVPTEREVKIGGKNTEVFTSLDNSFRLRHTDEFMGVPLEKLHNRWYALLKRNHERESIVVWQLVRRFKSLNSALHYVKEVKEGTREVRLYVPGDDARKSRALTRFQKKQRKLKKGK